MGSSNSEGAFYDVKNSLQARIASNFFCCVTCVYARGECGCGIGGDTYMSVWCLCGCGMGVICWCVFVWMWDGGDMLVWCLCGCGVGGDM